MEPALENHGWGNCCRPLVRDLWKTEFKDMKTTLGDMEVDVAMEVVLDQ